MSVRIIDSLRKYNRTIASVSDKSISIRAIILCSYARGESTINNLSLCDDVMSAIDCMKKLGAKIELNGNTAHIVGAPFNSAKLYCGNSATTARLLIGLLSGLNGVYEIDGDMSLRNRPMRNVIEPLSAMGARITSTDGKLPIKITGAALSGLEYRIPIASAQVKSALLFAALNASGAVTVIEKCKTRNHTEIMLKEMNGIISTDGNKITVMPTMPSGTEITVPNDISAAAYPICLALAVDGGSCVVKNVGINDTRIGILSVLRNIGAEITVTDKCIYNGECRADITAARKRLKPIKLDECDIPSVIDEIPALCALACFIDGTSVIEGCSALRTKETDRIKTIVASLKALDADIKETANDGIVICGGKKLAFGKVDPCGDHRIAMSAAIAGAAGNGAEIIGAECVSVSYPEFFKEVIDA